MFYLKLLSIIASLFVVYPIRKFIKKDEINIFDLIILFHTIFFCFVPAFSNNSAYQWLKGFSFEDVIIFRIFIYYTVSISLISIADIFWTKYFKYKRNILNITFYLRTLPQIEVSWCFIGLLIINLLISWLWYLPQASYMETFSELSKSQGYVKSPLSLLYGTIFTFCFSFSQIIFLKENLLNKKKNIFLFIVIGFGLSLLFLPRRLMLFYIILSVLIVYSIKRVFFTPKRITYIIVLLFLIIKIYFPFYNVMRNTTVKIDSSNFTTSLIYIIKDAYGNFGSKKDNATKDSEGRSLNLYYSLYRIIKYDKSPSNGGLFIAAIDHALPKFINPNKGLGTEKILEKKMQCNTDQADSILLLAYGDYGLILGSFYSLLLFLLIFFVYILLHKCSILFNKNSTIGMLLIVYLISISWNVEAKLDAHFASIVHLVVMSIILALLSRLNVIRNS